MMNSKEALKIIGNVGTKFVKSDKIGKPMIMYKVKELKKKEFNIIKESLKRLEQLEKENRELEEHSTELFDRCALLTLKVEELKKEYNDLKKDYDAKDLECIDLLKENKELKEEENRLCEDCGKLFWKYQKLEKAINILKEKLVPILLLQEVNTLEEYNEGLDDCDEYRLTQEEFDLLKQVFESVGRE